VIEANKALWLTLERFLAIDPAGAWALTEVTHAPRPELDEQGQPTGVVVLASTATFRRDPTEPTPTVVLTIADELPELDSFEQTA
jgi:hypothetical protein